MVVTRVDSGGNIIVLCPRCKTVFHDLERAANPDSDRCPKDGWKLIVDRTGTRLERFLVSRFLGVGGGGSSVWVATETLSQAPLVTREVALKLLPLKDNDAQEQARFERGAILAESLDHPNIARVYAHGRMSAPDGEVLWVTMELLAGDTLSAAATGRRIFTPRGAVEIADQILSALELAHANGIVHRDLKPANLYLTPVTSDQGVAHPPHLRILDFGIARLTGRSAAERFGPFFPDDEPAAPELESEVTGQHRICGTPEYMAPEQILGGPPETRSDLYALGVILYRLLTGQLPFRARTRYEIYHRHLHDPAPPLPPGIKAPTPLAVAVFRALHKKAEDRFPDARAMRECLRDAVGMPPLQRPKLFPTDEFARPDLFALAPALSMLPAPAVGSPADTHDVSIHGPLPSATPPAASPHLVAQHHPSPAPEPIASTSSRRKVRIIAMACAALALIGAGVALGLALSGESASAQPQVDTSTVSTR